MVARTVSMIESPPLQHVKQVNSADPMVGSMSLRSPVDRTILRFDNRFHCGRTLDFSRESRQCRDDDNDLRVPNLSTRSVLPNRVRAIP